MPSFLLTLNKDTPIPAPYPAALRAIDSHVQEYPVTMHDPIILSSGWKASLSAHEGMRVQIDGATIPPQANIIGLRPTGVPLGQVYYIVDHCKPLKDEKARTADGQNLG